MMILKKEKHYQKIIKMISIDDCIMGDYYTNDDWKLFDAVIAEESRQQEEKRKLNEKINQSINLMSVDEVMDEFSRFWQINFSDNQSQPQPQINAPEENNEIVVEQIVNNDPLPEMTYSSAADYDIVPDSQPEEEKENPVTIPDRLKHIIDLIEQPPPVKRNRLKLVMKGKVIDTNLPKVDVEKINKERNNNKKGEHKKRLFQMGVPIAKAKKDPLFVTFRIPSQLKKK
jgi:hypothetical protein